MKKPFFAFFDISLFGRKSDNLPDICYYKSAGYLVSGKICILPNPSLNNKMNGLKKMNRQIEEKEKNE